MNFIDKYENRKLRTGSRLVVGLDPVLEKMPPVYSEIGRIANFFEKIIDATCDLVLGYKPNIAFFEQYGPEGLKQLKFICHRIREQGALLILDAKRGDIGHTNRAYAREIFEYYGADATTINPLLGFSSLKEFLDYKDKYLFVLNFTSNPGSEQFFLYGDKPLYREISDEISRYKNCGAVAGATKLEYLTEISKRVGDSIILVPGIGAQGGSVERSIEAIGGDKFIFNASRSIIYASHDEMYHEASRKSVIEINEVVSQAMNHPQTNLWVSSSETQKSASPSIPKGIPADGEGIMSEIDHKILDRLRESGGLLTGHFQLTSGLHSQNYIQCAKALVHPDDVEFFARGLIKLLPPVNYIISPAIGALVIGYKVADILGIPFVFAERDKDGKMAIRRGLDVPAGAKAAVIEDVVTTGGSVKEVVRLLQKAGVEVLKVCSMVRRNDIRELGGVPFEALVYLDFEQYDKEECPLCAKGAEIEKPGSGK